jgi:hypothetical protein
MQLHALFAARQVGVELPREMLDAAMQHLRLSNAVSKADNDPRKREAGMMYSTAVGGGQARPALTAAAVAALLHAGQNSNELLVPWLNLVQSQIPLVPPNHFGLDDYAHYHLAQICYSLGEDRHARFRPDLAEAEKDPAGGQRLLKWSRYRQTTFARLAKAQKADGSWTGGYIGPVYSTAVNLIILQLELNHVPFYRRGCP